MKKLYFCVCGMGAIPIAFFKFGCSLIILALSGLYFLCEGEALAGGVGIELYYAPMLDYILTGFIIFWAGTLLLDILERELRLKKDDRRH